jgi:hypothetical protein
MSDLSVRTEQLVISYRTNIRIIVKAVHCRVLKCFLVSADAVPINYFCVEHDRTSLSVLWRQLMTHGSQTRESLCKGKSQYAYKFCDSSYYEYLRMLKIRSTATTFEVMGLHLSRWRTKHWQKQGYRYVKYDKIRTKKNFFDTLRHQNM